MNKLSEINSGPMLSKQSFRQNLPKYSKGGLSQDLKLRLKHNRFGGRSFELNANSPMAQMRQQNLNHIS
jgi:hypothetical protein